MSKRPGKLDEINYVIEFVTDFCDAPFSIYARSFRDASLKLVISYYALDLAQIVTGFIRPNLNIRGRRSGPHRRGTKLRTKPKTFIEHAKTWLKFDPWDFIGKSLNEAVDLEERQVHHGVHTLWEIFDHLQRLAYWYMVFDLTTEFFYNWASGVENSRYCQAQHMPIVVAEGTVQTFSGNGTKYALLLPLNVKQRGDASWNVVFGGVTAKSCTAMLTAEITPKDGSNIAGTYIRLAEPNEGRVANSDPILGPGGIVTCAFTGAHSIGVGSEIIVWGSVEVRSASVTCMGNNGAAQL